MAFPPGAPHTSRTKSPGAIDAICAAREELGS